MTSIHLRPATEQDIAAILAVTRAAYLTYADRLDPASGVFNEEASAVERYLQSGGIIVAEADGQIVGAVRYEAYPTYVYLGRLAVTPAWQGHGIGRRLIAAVEEWTILIGLDEVQLGVRRELTENRALYLRLGYVDDGYVPFERDPCRTYLRMKKRLRD